MVIVSKKTTKKKTSTLLVHSDEGSPTLVIGINEALEGNNLSAQVEAMKKAILILINNNGKSPPQIFITIVRYVLPSEDHTLQKLLLLYLEIMDKTDSGGRVIPEMFLIFQNLRNNLQHMNEYVRGVTLRFLCRLSESEIIEPLVPLVLSNLDHRHPFVRRNAILAVMYIYNNLPQGGKLLVDAPEMIEKALRTEQDPAAMRNAFLTLFNCDRTRAMSYLRSSADRVPEWNEPMQMAALDSIRKVCGSDPAEKGKYIVIVVSLLTDTSAAVMYECAGMLASLSSAPTSIRSAAKTYCQLLISQRLCDNVKLIVLDRLEELKSLHREMMVDVIGDLLLALPIIPDIDIRRKILEIATELITPTNVGGVLLNLKEESVKTLREGLGKNKNVEYTEMLNNAIESCAKKVPKVANTVVLLLVDLAAMHLAAMTM